VGLNLSVSFDFLQASNVLAERTGFKKAQAAYLQKLKQDHNEKVIPAPSDRARYPEDLAFRIWADRLLAEESPQYQEEAVRDMLDCVKKAKEIPFPAWKVETTYDAMLFAPVNSDAQLQAANHLLRYIEELPQSEQKNWFDELVLEVSVSPRLQGAIGKKVDILARKTRTDPTEEPMSPYSKRAKESYGFGKRICDLEARIGGNSAVATNEPLGSNYQLSAIRDLLDCVKEIPYPRWRVRTAHMATLYSPNNSEIQLKAARVFLERIKELPESEQKEWLNEMLVPFVTHSPRLQKEIGEDVKALQEGKTVEKRPKFKGHKHGFGHMPK
jgi:hypothetical protein